MARNQAKQRERWKINKREERARKSAYPIALSSRFIAAAVQERDRRILETPYIGDYWRYSNFTEQSTYEKALRFAADVWAADFTLTAQWGPGGAKPRRVKDWLDRYGHEHGYTSETLRKMLPIARKRIQKLQTTTSFIDGAPFWPAFDP